MHAVVTYVEVVALTLKLGRGVDLVGHDARDGLLYVLHPLDHLCLAHQVDILDERVIFLPERHGGGLVLLGPCKEHTVNV